MSDSAHFFFSSFLNFSALNEIPEIFEKTSPLSISIHNVMLPQLGNWLAHNTFSYFHGNA